MVNRVCEAPERGPICRGSLVLIEVAETAYKELKKHSLLVESMELATTFVVNGTVYEMNLLRCDSRDTMVFR